MNINGDKNAVPDSWDQDDVSDNFNSLNVGAKPFVPNAFAQPFVPKFGAPPMTNIKSTDDDVPISNHQPLKSNEDIVPETESVVQEVVENEPVQDVSPVKDEPVTHQEEESEPDEEEVEEEPKIPYSKPKIKKNVEEEMEPDVKKDHLNVVFIGHVDAGKSTIGGQIMYLTGMVDKRTLEKYEREAKEKNRETWYLSWVVDTNLEEREKGKTVEVGRAYFETETKHFTILDAPGHRSFVPNMIGGTSQADVAVLVISARRGEFETGFERGGQTREHAMLAKTAGVRRLIVLINKMDDSTVKWKEERYNECKEKLLPFLKKVGFRKDKDIHFMPCSGLTGLMFL